MPPERLEIVLDDSVEPTSTLGVNHTLLEWDASSNISVRNGNYETVVADVRRTGAGVLRQLGPSDLLWTSLLDATAIPAPGEIRSLLAEDQGTSGAPSGFGAFERFVGAALLCAESGMALIPTLFTLGGGSSINEDALDGEFGDLSSGRPDAHRVDIVPSREGWDTAYQTGKAQHTYALNLWFEEAATTARRISMIRKCLALVAYAEVVGEMLLLLADELDAEHGLALTDVVPFLECGNEFDQYWLPEDPEANPDLVWQSAMEFGRFVALLAGPIHNLVPEARFRVGELLSPMPGDRWPYQREWLKTAVIEGITKEVERWKEIQDGADEEWAEETAAAGIDWPPMPYEDESGTVVTPDLPTAKDLVQQVGFHWYHHLAKTVANIDEYATASQLAEDTEAFIGEVVKPINEQGFSVTASCSETGFPAEYYEFGKFQPPDASPLLQAGQLVTRLLVLLASGVENVCWHTRMSQVLKREALGRDSEFFAMGLREDVGTLSSFTYSTDAHRRSSWYALRRLAWFLQSTRSLRIMQDSGGGFIAVRLTASSDGFTNPHDAADSGWRFAYFLWNDRTLTFPLSRAVSLGGASAFSRLPVAPKTTAFSPATNWKWSGWDAAPVAIRDGELTVGLPPLDASNPLPVCILADVAIDVHADISLKDLPPGFP